MNSISGLALGLALGTVSLGYAIPLSAPTPVKWNASSCPTGVAKVTGIVCDERNNCYSAISEDVKLPVSELTQTFPNIPPTNYVARAHVEYIDGTSFSSAVQNIIGLGDAPVPTPIPTITPEPTVTPTPTPEPTPIQEIPAVNFTKYTKGDVWVRVPGGNAYSFSECCGWMLVRKSDLPDDYLLPGQGPEPGAWGREFTFVNNTLVVHDTREQYNKWYILRADHTGFTLFNGTGEEPLLNPVPTPTPTPIPSTDLKPLIDGISNANALLLQLLGLMTPPVSVTCQITSVGSYANGDQKLTVRCSPSGFATGQSISVIKK